MPNVLTVNANASAVEPSRELEYLVARLSFSSVYRGSVTSVDRAACARRGVAAPVIW